MANAEVVRPPMEVSQRCVKERAVAHYRQRFVGKVNRSVDSVLRELSALVHRQHPSIVGVRVCNRSGNHQFLFRG